MWLFQQLLQQVTVANISQDTIENSNINTLNHNVSSVYLIYDVVYTRTSSQGENSRQKCEKLFPLGKLLSQKNEAIQ